MGGQQIGPRSQSPLPMHLRSFTDEHRHHHPNYPAARPLPPDSSQAALRLIADLDEAVRSQNEQDRNRIELSLQWLCRASETFGVDSFLMYWFALETLAMPGGELVALNKQLAKIFPSHAAVRHWSRIKSLYGVRGILSTMVA